MQTLAVAKTDVGRSRAMNQDYVFSSTEPIGSLDNLFILADGMGGHNAGDYASHYVVDELVAYFSNPQEGKDVHSILKNGIAMVNKSLFELAQGDIELQGTGTTLVVATIKGRVLYVANVGDSRLYLVRDNLIQMTRDHSYVEELVALGKLRRDSLDYKKKKNIITRAIGMDINVDVDLFAQKLKTGDLILMCSDGLTTMVDELEIEYIIHSDNDLEKQVTRLVDAANRSGGKDNISVIMISPQISEVSL